MSSVLDFSPPLSLTHEVDRLEDALGHVADLVGGGWLESLSTEELLSTTVTLQRIASRAQALAVAAAAEVRDHSAVRAEGFTAISRWLEVRAGLSTRESRAVVGTGEKLQWEFPSTREAWLAGAISQAVVHEITTGIPRALKALPDSDYAVQRERLESRALTAARSGATVAEVGRVIARASFAADPAGSDQAVAAARESEFLRLTPTTGGVDVRGFLSTESAALVLTAFDQRVDALHRSGSLPEQELAGLAAPAPRRRAGTREHINARILAELVGHLLGDGLLGSRHAQRPHVTVTVHADDYRGGLGGEILLPGFGAVPVPPSTIDRILCDADVHPVMTTSGAAPDTGGPIAGPPDALAPPGSIRRHNGPPWSPPPFPWLTSSPAARPWEPTAEEIDSDTDVAALVELGEDLDDPVSFWQRLVGEPGRHVLDVGRSFRTAPPKLRRALAVRDGGCAAPGCGVDPSRCEAHHIVHWEHQGETAIANMVLLCSKHHHLVHEGGMRIELDHDRDPGDPGHVTLAPAPRAA